MISTLKIARLDWSQQESRQAIAQLREKLSPRGDIVSPAGRQRTLEAFGEPLTPNQVVERICTAIRDGGLDALREYSQRIDQNQLDLNDLRVSPEEFEAAHRQADPKYLATIAAIRDNILEFQTGILHADAMLRRSHGCQLRQRYRPLRRVGLCVPGGAAAYPSSLLMTAVPAQAAGVRQIAVVTPPTDFGGYNPDLLAACHAIGITEVYRIGGAQGVASLAYGIPGHIEQVDKIVGPGNLFVALAKRFVFGEVDIDSISGPSEVIVIADYTAHPRFVASDLISQAEHSPGSSLLITWEPELIDRVVEELDVALAQLGRGDLARDSLEQFGALILVKDEDEAVALTNQFAPEHLHVSTSEPNRLAERLTNAGAIFLGHHTPVAVGDYAAGPSHVLPTSGTARWASGLSANDFLKKTSILQFDPESLRVIAPLVQLMADQEGLTAHRHSVDVRLDVERNGTH